VASAAAGPALAPPVGTTATAPVWIHFDIPLWDIADDGLPFRLTLSLPSPLDPLSRILYASEARWTFSAGYA
jgi:hypothetical protein